MGRTETEQSVKCRAPGENISEGEKEVAGG